MFNLQKLKFDQNTKLIRYVLLRYSDEFDKETNRVNVIEIFICSKSVNQFKQPTSLVIQGGTKVRIKHLH